MPSSARKLLDVLDVTPVRAFTWTQAAMLAGYSESGGGFRSGKKWLLDTGAAIEDGGRVRVAKPSGNKPALTGEALVTMWADRLPPAAVSVLSRMWSSRPARNGAAAEIGALAEQLNYQTTGGGWRSGIKALRDAGIANVSGGRIAFTPEFIEIAGAA
jgi:hypothetical protein